MNYKEYLELLAEDLNLIFKEDNEKSNTREREHLLRIRILMLHLHTDYLLSEIIARKLQSKLKTSENKKNFETKNIEFIEKLRLVYATGDFEEDLFNTFRILNQVRNSLSHNLIINLAGEEDKIKSLELNQIVSENRKNSLSSIEHLLYSSLGYINLIAEYLYEKVLGEKLNHTLCIKNSPGKTNRIIQVWVAERTKS